jgi:predicted nucleotidyltransferase
MGALLEQRRRETADRIGRLRNDLTSAKTLCDNHGCVYATGSFARGEASSHSDLDLFIVSQGLPERPSIRGLEQILIKADLIEATRNLRIPDFSGDGEYLKHYTVRELVQTLGTPEDDVTNTFTARLLLLLESFPLVGETARITKAISCLRFSPTIFFECGGRFVLTTKQGPKLRRRTAKQKGS